MPRPANHGEGPFNILWPQTKRLVFLGLSMLGFVGLSPLQTWANDIAAGEAIYRQHCLSCHGEDGQGTTQQPRQLVGDKSIFELSALIERTMPEGEPELVVGEDAKRVAAYIHQRFYSPTAQARLNPPRIEASRLTVRQYREVLADLLGSFSSPRPPQAAREFGLRGEYFRSRRFRSEDRLIDRLDRVVQFDFGDQAPQPGEFDPAEFAIRWQGSVLAPETGLYEIVIQAENAARLWLNHTRQPLIDAWVKSGSETVHRQSIWLLGGRHYPLKLEFFKSKQGKETRAAVALQWKPPHGVLETIPARYLSPVSHSATFVVRTAFPPDDRIAGYERGTTLSLAWEQASVQAAIETANAVVQNLPDLVRDRAANEPVKDRERLQAFCETFVERACRRPLTPEQRELFIQRPFQESAQPEEAVKRVVLLTLLSPRFLVVETGHRPDAFSRASRLALGLWDSLPDPQLLEAASAGRLETSEDVAREARRMLDDPRTSAKLLAFLQQWLRVDQFDELSKDPQAFSQFSPDIAADLRTSLYLFLDELIHSSQADYRQLLLADELFLNARLAALYGDQQTGTADAAQGQPSAQPTSSPPGPPQPAAQPIADQATATPPTAPSKTAEPGVSATAQATIDDADFRKVRFDSRERLGVLTHPFLLSGFAYSAESSPIHRGVFVARSLLGRSLRPPPEAVNPLPAELHPDLTTRERIQLQTRGESCRSCHDLINPLGFPLEGFNAIGQLRSEERGKPIDDSGGYLNRNGESVTFSGPHELAEFLARSPEAHQAFVEQLFDYIVKQPARAFGPHTPEKLVSQFAAHDFNIRELLVDIMVVAAQTESAGLAADHPNP